MSLNPVGSMVLASGGKSNSGGFPNPGKGIGDSFNSIGKGIGKAGKGIGKAGKSILKAPGKLFGDITFLIELGIGASIAGGLVYILIQVYK